MTVTTKPSPASSTHSAERAIALALRLADAEHALQALASGQIDAVIDPSGKTYLLRPAQEHLRESERRLQAVIESAADAITVVNRGGAILSQSLAVRRVLGYEPDELVGRSIFELIHEDDLTTAHSAFLNVIEEFYENATASFRHRTRDGSYRMIDATVGKLRDGSSPHVTFSLRPGHPRARTNPVPPEAAPVQASLVTDRFVAMVAHELRAPVQPILLGLDELQANEDFAEARPTLAMIRRNIKLQTRLLEELMEFAQIDQNKVLLRPELIDVHEHVRYVLEICQGEITTAQIEVVLHLRADEAIVQTDPVKLQQVMWNLVNNAIKFSIPGGRIIISSFNDAPGVLTLEFADHGVGIEPHLLPLVFNPFQQGDRWALQRYGGLGLGLFIAKGLAEALGGTLTVASKGRDQGATFRLTINTTSSPDAPA